MLWLASEVFKNPKAFTGIVMDSDSFASNGNASISSHLARFMDLFCKKQTLKGINASPVKSSSSKYTISNYLRRLATEANILKINDGFFHGENNVITLYPNIVSNPMNKSIFISTNEKR